ncbi:MAG: DUF4339 domain-containing protein [Verrucomicrobia bacterium]|nr:DUF4339 domain-containing protein [Verrucomicrobiota bacterium]
MYCIIGGDQKEYGPVPVDQIRQWILEGRANGDTRARLESGAEWQPLRSFPEFADALAAQSPRFGLAPPPIPAEDPTARLDEYAARGATLDIGACITRSWDLLRDHFWLLVGASALILVVNVALEFIPAIGQVAGAALSLVLWAGLDWVFLKLARGQPADMADAFAGFQINFVQLMLASIVTTVLILVGIFLCVLPGIYLMVAWLGFGPLLIIDKQLEFWPALELSRKVVHRNWWTIFALFILTTVIAIAGFMAVGIGIFVTLPLATGAVVYAYEDLFGVGRP